MDIRDICDALVETADLIALAVCRRTTPKSDMLSQRELYKLYDRNWINYHIAHKNIIGVKSGSAKNSSVLYSRLKIEALRKAEEIESSMING